MLILAAENGKAGEEGEGGSANQVQSFNEHFREFQQKLKMQGGGMSKKDWAFWNTQPVPKFDEVH